MQGMLAGVQTRNKNKQYGTREPAVQPPRVQVIPPSLVPLEIRQLIQAASQRLLVPLVLILLECDAVLGRARARSQRRL